MTKVYLSNQSWLELYNNGQAWVTKTINNSVHMWAEKDRNTKTVYICCPW